MRPVRIARPAVVNHEAVFVFLVLQPVFQRFGNRLAGLERVNGRAFSSQFIGGEAQRLSLIFQLQGEFPAEIFQPG